MRLQFEKQWKRIILFPATADWEFRKIKTDRKSVTRPEKVHFEAVYLAASNET